MLLETRLAAVFLLFQAPLAGQERVDWEAVNRIRNEGFHRSQVMDTLFTLTDVIGPRLTGSPGMKNANQWSRDRLKEWGLENAHLESWGPFGRGWSFSRASAHMLAPHQLPLPALPKAWTPGTGGPVRGEAILARFESEDDLEKYQGKLAGKVVFLSSSRDIADRDQVLFRRFTDEQLADLGEFRIPGDRSGDARRRFRRRRELMNRVRPFLVEEKALATIEISSRDAGLIRVGGGGSRDPEEDPGIPGLVMATEYYNRVLRLLDKKHRVEIEIDVAARFHDEDTMAYNTVAEIPGSDLADQVVMLGAHLDSWHAGSGATDNAAGSSVAMEAVRILKALGVQPRRTIRVALWSGEEQGLLGSRAYVARHLAERPQAEDSSPRQGGGSRGPLEIKPQHGKFSVYFNLDNGSGKIRGIYCQENAAAMPIFEQWLRPFHDLGADTVSPRNTGGTDHLSFDAVGLPGFQFIQDQLDYSTQTHHTNLDVYDHLRREDMMQASVIMASFVYHAAMRDELFPRKPMPETRERTETTGR